MKHGRRRLVKAPKYGPAIDGRPLTRNYQIRPTNKLFSRRASRRTGPRPRELARRVKRVELNRSACACRTQTGGLPAMGIVSESWGRGKEFAPASRREACRDRGELREGEGTASLRRAGGDPRGHTPPSLRAWRGEDPRGNGHAMGGLMICPMRGPGGGPKWGT